MNAEETRAILTICLLAAYADGDKHDREREQIRQVAQGLAQDEQVNLPGLYQDVLLRRVQLADVLARLQSGQSRQLAYEMAVCVCEADGHTSPKEQDFLAQLRQAWGMGASGTGNASNAATAVAGYAGAASGFDSQAQAVADAPLTAQLPDVGVLPAPVSYTHLTLPTILLV